jgi:hypothetical protein
MDKKELNREEVERIVEVARRDPQNVIKMIQKYGDRAIRRIHDGKLHLDFDDREGTSYNNDLLKLMPFKMKHPVSFTSWKGIIYVHCLDFEIMNCSAWSTADILTEIIMKHGEDLVCEL